MSDPLAPRSPRLVPLTRAEARKFVAQYHRHSKPPSVCIAQVGVADGDLLLGVVMVGRPLSRMLCDGRTLEVLRVCTSGSRNVCSMLYGSAARAAKALGYTRLVTYTLVSEQGTSLKASGWKQDPEVRTHDPRGWERQKCARGRSVDLFGNRTTPDEPKVRWWRHL